MPLIANVSAAKATDPTEIRDLLVQQVTAMVRWRECVNAMVELGVRQLRRTWRRQGAVRPDPPHRARCRHRLGRDAGRGRSPAEGAVSMFRLDGKAALVTGASGGIGAAIARALHAQGAAVVLSGTRRDALEALAAELGDRAFVCPADLRDAAGTDALVESAEKAAGPLWAVVNNAGMTRDMLALRMSDADWQAVLDVDLSAPFRLAARRCAACCAGAPGASSTSPPSSAPPAMPARPTTPPPRPGWSA